MVMRHEGLNDAARLAAPLARWRVIDRFEHPEARIQAFVGKLQQVRAGFGWRHHQRQRRGIWSDHQIISETALQPKPRHAEGPILIVVVRIDGVVAALGYAPRHAALAPVVDLPLDSGFVRLIEQRVFVRRHHQQRHQILEHRAAP